MLTNEQINTFQELHRSLGNLGFKYSFTYSSLCNEFQSLLEDIASKAFISKTLLIVDDNSQDELEAYRKLLINLIERRKNDYQA